VIGYVFMALCLIKHKGKFIMLYSPPGKCRDISQFRPRPLPCTSFYKVFVNHYIDSLKICKSCKLIMQI
jgi:hypothetical protein